MGDNFFELAGERNPTIQVPVGEETTIDLENGGLAIHNMRIAGLDDSYNTDDDFVSDPDLFAGGDTGFITFQFDEAGTFIYRCDFHPAEMVGEIEVQ
jgi:plastocyanin